MFINYADLRMIWQMSLAAAQQPLARGRALHRPRWTLQVTLSVSNCAPIWQLLYTQSALHDSRHVTAVINIEIACESAVYEPQIVVDAGAPARTVQEAPPA